MYKHTNQMSPQEIRAIREMLGLTQAEAGEIIGGGPRAFTKYEAGTVQPNASAVNLLRLLESDPNNLHTLRPDRKKPMSNVASSPFEVSGNHVAVLNERMLPLLTRRLLNAEADAYDLPAPVIHVSDNIHSADGGEDARITWSGGPSETRFLPSRSCQFQLKSGSIGKSAAGQEVLSKDRSVKGMVSSFLQSGGYYIVLCTSSYSQKEIQEREESIRLAVREAGLTIADEQVQFREAGQIADWVNHHPAVALWLKEQTQPGTIGPFRSWIHWAGDGKHDSIPWVEDERLPTLKQGLYRLITQPGGVAKVVGLSGVGKTRLLMEALSTTAEEEGTGRRFRDYVMYVSRSHCGSETIATVMKTLVDIGQRAIVVVDDCDAETHRLLSALVKRSGSRVSLVTVYDEVPSEDPDDDTIEVRLAPASVTEGIIDQALPGLPSEDKRRLARFSLGFPSIATRLGLIWPKSEPIVNATDSAFVDVFLLGRSPRNKETLLQSAELLSVFDLVRIETADDEHIAEIASLGHNLGPEDFFFAVKDLADRGIVQKRGRFFRLQPRPIALRLARRQWLRWTPESWDQVLAGSIRADLKVAAARQLTYLNDTAVASKVVKSVCRYGGPFDGVEGVSRSGHCEILSSLAEIDAETVMDQLERSLNQFEDIGLMAGDSRQHLERALSTIAFLQDTFEESARLLLRMETTEVGTFSNQYTKRFPGLFPVLLGGTSADGSARLALLHELADEVARAGCTAMQLMVVKALSAGIKTDYFSRMSGPEAHGARPALQSWMPATQIEASEYISGCLSLLTEFTLHNDEAGGLARTELGQSLGSLIRHGFIDTVEPVVHRVNNAVGFWPEAFRNLNHVLSYNVDTLSTDETTRVRELIAELRPQSIESRVRALVTELAWRDVTTDEGLDPVQRSEHHTAAVRDLATELIELPSVLEELLPQLCSGRQAMAFVLGQTLAHLSDPPLTWLTPIAKEVAELPKANRNFELLAGYIAGCTERVPESSQRIKKALLHSPELSSAFPIVSASLGITPRDIELAVNALNEGTLSPPQLNIWSYGSVLSEVPARTFGALIDAILEPVYNLFRISVAKARTTICRLVLSFRSQFFQSRRHFSSQAKDRSTTHLFGSTTKVCSSLRFTTSTAAPNRLRTPAAKGFPV